VAQVVTEADNTGYWFGHVERHILPDLLSNRRNVNGRIEVLVPQDKILTRDAFHLTRYKSWMKYKSRYGPVEFDVFINSNLAEDPLEISYISDEKKSAGGILLCVVWAHPNLRADGKMTSWQARKNLERYAPFHVQAYDDWKKHEKRHGPIDYFTFVRRRVTSSHVRANMEQDCVIQALSHADTKQENGPVIAVRQIPRFIRFLRGQGFPIDPSEFENNLAPMPNPPAPQARRALINQLSVLGEGIYFMTHSEGP
ncbi:hypothetical protein LEN26_014862, partial [Aphanomyces euteiches]